MDRLVLLVFCVLLTLGGRTQSQEAEHVRIEIVSGDEWAYDKEIGPDVTIIRGNAVFKHEEAYLYCDSAYLNEKKNNLDAFGNVHVVDHDTVNLWGNRLSYDGNTRIVVMRGRVKLQDPSTTLYADPLFYDRNKRVAYYTTGGRILNDENTLTSVYGAYLTEEQMLFFNDSVVVTGPDYTTRSDTLRYDTQREILYFHGPASLHSEANRIYCEEGFYDTKKERCRLSEKVIIYYEEQILKADSVFYNKAAEYGEAFRNVHLLDTVQRVEIVGHYAEYARNKGFSYVTDSAVAMLYEKRDTLYLHADTLKTYFNDSTRQVEQMICWLGVKFYRDDIQGMCDSLSYGFADSTIVLYQNPVLWSEENQLTADTIAIFLQDGAVSSLTLANSSFIVSLDDTTQFNQVKGKNMTALFAHNKLHTVRVNEQAHTLYYLRDEEGHLVGINKATSEDMKIWIADNRVKRIAYLKKPKAPLYPPEKLPLEERILQGFRWLQPLRPLHKADIFQLPADTVGN
ncbi:MAG: hypothetical protein CSA95_05615 [Bacteroidetes bacterium]|nr:MAG: hypothetical protein CSA95_05615 [Bacteroidota bacterium]PIE88387.1 MAG: hypothetical protein CSA04_02180 [Bacteroidota bacterium]